MMTITKEDSVIGCLLGTAVGDAIGLCCEGMSKKRQRRIFGDIDRYHFLFGRGMISDDTEHTCMVAQALIVSGGDTNKFTKSLAWRFRFWLLCLPAGIGFATLRSILKLWLGFPSHRSGVFSAGNGPAMRSAIIGVCYGQQPKKMLELVRASTRITHTDPKAEFGALAVGLAAYMASRGEIISPEDFLKQLQNALESEKADEFLELMDRAINSAVAGTKTESFAWELGLSKGISGYIYHTVPVVIHSWLRHQRDFRTAIIEIVRCGGDTDTTAAILGSIIGSGVGKRGIPREWLDGLWEWPRTVRWMEQLGQKLAQCCYQGVKGRALRLPFYGILLRNAFFVLVVIAHVFRRLFPPY